MGVNVGNNPLAILSDLEPVPVRDYLSKRWWLWITHESSMERTIDTLLQRLGIPRQDLLLPCTFCAKYLTQEELTAFEFSNFNLIWRGGCVFGVCVSCARLCASLDVLQHFGNSLPALDVIAKEGKGLDSISVRCRVCLHRLSFTEKLQAAERSELFAKVRGRWRARCRICKFV
nr:E6 protein [Rodent papillomavirus]